MNDKACHAIRKRDYAYVRKNIKGIRRMSSQATAYSPWMVVLMQRNIRMAEIFLEHGESPNKKGSQGNPDLAFLVRHHKTESFDDWIDLFLQYGSNIHVKNYKGETLLHTAIEADNKVAVAKLRSLSVAE